MCSIADAIQKFIDASLDERAQAVHKNNLDRHRERCGVCEREAEIDAIKRQGGKVLWADGNVWMVR